MLHFRLSRCSEISFFVVNLLSRNLAVEQEELIPDQLSRFNAKQSRPVSPGFLRVWCQIKQNERKTYRMFAFIVRVRALV